MLSGYHLLKQLFTAGVRPCRPDARVRPQVEWLELRRLLTFQLPGLLSVGTTPDTKTTADLSGDGRSDLITANQSGNYVTVLLGHGDGTFGSAHSYATGQSPVAVTTADLLGNGVLDVITAN